MLFEILNITKTTPCIPQYGYYLTPRTRMKDALVDNMTRSTAKSKGIDFNTLSREDKEEMAREEWSVLRNDPVVLERLGRLGHRI
jgi:hypothetical protein